MADFFDEVEQDVRQQKLRKFFEQYGNYIVTFLVLVVLSTAAGGWYKSHKQAKAEESGEIFSEAADLAQAGKNDLADAKLQEVVKEGSTGYKQLAKLQIAQNLEKKNDLAGAITIYKEVEQSGVEHALADMAALHRIFLQMENPSLLKEGEDLDKDLEELSDTKRPWRFSALELQGVLAMKKENFDKARTIFTTLQEDAFSPRSIKARAEIMLAKLPKTKA